MSCNLFLLPMTFFKFQMMFGTMKLTYGPQKRSRGALKNTNIRSPWVRTAPKPQRIRRPGWPGPTRPPKPPPPLRQPPSPMLFVQLTPCCILFPPWEALRHSWVYSLLQREVLSGINVATPYGTNLWAFTHWFIWHVSFDTLINEASEAQQPAMSPISVNLDTSLLPHSLDSESLALSNVIRPRSTPLGSRRYISCRPSQCQCAGGQFNSFVEISTDFSTDFSTEFL